MTSASRGWGWLAAILLLTCALYSPSFSNSFVAGSPNDDRRQLATLGGAPTTTSTRLDLWAFYSGQPDQMEALRRHGHVHWSFPLDYRWSFWRPLSSAVSVVDYALFGENMLGYHLDCTLWWLLLVSLVWKLFRAEADDGTAALATFAFAVLPGAPDAVCWIPARHIVVASALAVAGLVLHVRFRRTGARRSQLASLLCIAIAFTASEVTLQTLAFVAAFELCGTAGALRDRAKALAPFVVVTCVYLFAYAKSGSGVHHAQSLGYHNPFEEPLATLQNGLRIVPALIFETLSALPYSSEKEQFTGMWISGGLLLVGALAVLLRHARRDLSVEQRRSVRWLLVGSALSFIPALPSQASPRMIVMPTLGLAFALATIARGGWGRLREARLVTRLALASLLAITLVPHFLVAPIVLTSGIIRGKRANDAECDETLRAAEAIERAITPTASTVLLFKPPFGPSMAHALHRPDWRNQHWWPLPEAVSLVRSSPNTLDVTLRPPRKLDIQPARRVGDVITLDAFDVVIAEVDASGQPLSVTLRFATPLEDRARELLRLTKSGWERIELPIGGRLAL